MLQLWISHKYVNAQTRIRSLSNSKWLIASGSLHSCRPVDCSLFGAMCMRLQSTLLDVHKCQKWSYLPCLAFLAFRMESHFHCGLGTKDFVVPWCWMLLNFCRTETSCKCVLPQLPWFYEFFDISARTRISPSLRKAKRCPDVYRWFWHGWKVGPLKVGLWLQAHCLTCRNAKNEVTCHTVLS